MSRAQQSSSEKSLILDKQIQNIQREKSPSRDLWKGIEFEISKPQVNDGVEITKRSWSFASRPSLALAASFLIVSIVGFLGFQTGFNTSSQNIAELLSTQHKEQKQSLLAHFEGQQSSTENWQEQLAELDEAANAIKKALELEPNNTALLQMLKRVHQQQISLIERVHQPSWQQI